MMEEVIKYIETAHMLISKIPVSGDNVDIMATARINLKKAHELLNVDFAPKVVDRKVVTKEVSKEENDGRQNNQ